MRGEQFGGRHHRGGVPSPPVNRFKKSLRPGLGRRLSTYMVLLFSQFLKDFRDHVDHISQKDDPRRHDHEKQKKLPDNVI